MTNRRQPCAVRRAHIILQNALKQNSGIYTGSGINKSSKVGSENVEPGPYRSQKNSFITSVYNYSDFYLRQGGNVCYGRPCVLQISAVAPRRRPYKYRSSRLPHSLKQWRPSSSDRLSVVLRATASLSHFSLSLLAFRFPPCTAGLTVRAAGLAARACSRPSRPPI